MACQALPKQRAFALACRNLALHHPEAFDSTNRDDRAMLKLAPVLFDENGNPELNAIQERIQIQDATFAFHNRGDQGVLSVTARDKTGPPLQTRLAFKLKKPNSDSPESNEPPS